MRLATTAAALAIFAAGAPGCAFHGVGLATPAPAGPQLMTSDGATWQLVVSGDATALGGLDGHTAEVWGRRGVGRVVVVTDWKVVEGLHGMPVFVGPTAAMGSQVVIEDHNTGGVYFVDEEGADVLWPFVGEWVLVEGYVEGAHRVRVVYYRVLDGSTVTEEGT